MKIHRAETVTRYHISFSREESRTLSDHPFWSGKLHWQRDGIAQLELTRTELSTLCEDLGIDRVFSHPTMLGVLPVGNTDEYKEIVADIRTLVRKMRP